MSESRREPLGSPGLYITGIGSQYPEFDLGPEKLAHFAQRYFDVEQPGLKRLLEINRSTGIQSRSAIHSYEEGFACGPRPPTIDEIELNFRQHGTNLAAQACQKALEEWGGDLDLITHTVAVSCTSQGNPGYDVLVNQKLQLPAQTERILLHGVGCAGGSAILRVAAQIACGASARRKPARILAFACELCTPSIRHDLADAESLENKRDLGIAAVIFSDAAAAFVLCNEDGLEDGVKPLFELVEWGNVTLPETLQHLSSFAEPHGFKTVLSRGVPHYTTHAILPLFQQLNESYCGRLHAKLNVQDFDWALHPGGRAIISAAKSRLAVTDSQLRASEHIYKTKGNSSSPSVICVLDLLRHMGWGKNHIAATAFGPGLVCEMALLRRLCNDTT